MEQKIGQDHARQRFDWFQVLWRHRILSVLIVTGGMAFSAFWTARQSKIYRSSASVLLESSGGSIFGRAEPETMSNPETVRINTVLAESQPVIERIKVPGFQPPKGGKSALPAGFSARVEGQLLYLTVLDRSPEFAATLANAWSAAFIEEMTQRTVAPSVYAQKFLKRSLPELRRDWIAKQEALTQLEKETGYDPKDAENSPLRKRCDELANALTQKSITLASLQAEERLLTAPNSGPMDWLQLPRAQADTVIAAYRRQLDERRVKLQDLRDTLAPNSREIKTAERAVADAQQNVEAAARALASQVRSQAAQLRQECEQLKNLLSEAEAQFGDLRSKAARHRVLAAEAEIAEKLYAELAQKENESSLNGQFQYSYARPWEQAVISRAPFSPSWPRNLAVGLLVSLVLAGGSAALLELRDDTLRGSHDLEEQLNVAALGTIPTATTRSGLLLRAQADEPALFESLRSLQIGLESGRAAPEAPWLLAVTSGLPKEGKSFVCANLGEVFARLDRKVLLVDADLHRTTLTYAFDAQNCEGFYEALAHGHYRREHVLQVTKSGCHLLPAGIMGTGKENRCVHPERLKQVLAQMRKEFQVILFDTTPVLALADACIIAGLADCTLVVARARQTRLAHLRRTVARLSAANTPQMVFALNDVGREEAEAEGYGYYEDYYGVKAHGTPSRQRQEHTQSQISRCRGAKTIGAARSLIARWRD